MTLAIHTPLNGGGGYQTKAQPDRAWSQSDIVTTLQSDIEVGTPRGFPTPGQTGNQKHPTDDIMPHVSPGDGLMMSTKGSHVTIYYK